jgi:hypothetical protein
MWTIREDQLEILDRYQLQKFEDELVEHLQEFAPRHWKAIGDETGRGVIRLGFKQAERYGFTNRGPVRFYIEMMFMFGSFFDTDPQYPWAARVLNDQEGMSQMVRADRLYDEMRNYWVAVAGPKNQFMFAALRKLSQARAEDYLDPLVPLEDCLFAGLNSIYPQKSEYLGEPPLRALLKKTLELGNRLGFSANDQVCLLTALTFFLGHECARDPLHGWIGRRLADKRFADPRQCSAELQARAQLYLEYVLEGSETPA